MNLVVSRNYEFFESILCYLLIDNAAMSFLEEISKLTEAAPSIDPELIGFADQSAFISAKSTVSDLIYYIYMLYHVMLYIILYNLSIILRAFHNSSHTVL